MVAGTIACLLLVPVPATASPGSQLVPHVTCVTVNDDGTLTAHFGYTNNWSNQETVQIGFREGSANAFSPAPENRGQPTQLLPGTHDDVFSVTFPEPSLTWYLDDAKGQPNSATASASSTACVPVPALGVVDSPLPVALIVVGLGCLLALLARRGAPGAST